MKSSSVKIENVHKSFDSVKVLKDINLEINKGEFFSILGPSGCGKTTLLRMIAGFEEPDNGSIYLGNDNIISIPPNKRKVNTIFQTYALFPHLSVFDNVAFPLKLRKKSKSEIKREVEKYLEMVNLADQMNKFPSQMSGGQKQRVAIARALINHPSVLLLDEPLSALDAKLRQKMLIDLDTIHDEIGITFIYITHDQQEALSVSDRVAVMNYGEVLQVGTPAEIYETPSDPFVADFIGETNFIQGEVIDVNDEYGTLYSERIGKEIVFHLDEPVKKGDFVKLTVRPEKIRITRDKPENRKKHNNVLYGKVEDLIYAGFQTKFFVEIGDNRIKVFKQHVNYFEEEKAISWLEQVYIWWDIDDSHIVEVKS